LSGTRRCPVPAIVTSNSALICKFSLTDDIRKRTESMSRKDEKDTAGRKQPSKYLRTQRASNAARHRWKHKWELVPGKPLPWQRRSLANMLRHHAAAKLGGETTRREISEQQRLFWRWYHGDCKAQLRGPFKTVVETLERIEAAYVQRYGREGSKDLAWEGFMHDVFSTYILRRCGKMQPQAIERHMWGRFEIFLEADDEALHGKDGTGRGLLQPLFAYWDARDRGRML
jgi:hypothetical protein